MTAGRSLSTLGFLVLWVVAAGLAPGTTFHLAPVIVAGAAASALADRRRRGVLVGFGLATGAAIVLWSTGLLTGPSLLPVGGPLLESIVGAAAGAFGGSLLADRMSVPA